MLIPERNYTAREQTVCNILEPIHRCRSMLNIGQRDPAEKWWLDICIVNGIMPHLLEIHPPNAEKCLRAGYPNVTIGDVCECMAYYPSNSIDVVLWWHGPEHVQYDEALDAIGDLQYIAKKAVIIGCPLGFHPQGSIGKNEHERHVSEWQPTDFSGTFGMETVVVDDRPPFPHITAWRLF